MALKSIPVYQQRFHGFNMDLVRLFLDFFPCGGLTGCTRVTSISGSACWTLDFLFTPVGISIGILELIYFCCCTKDKLWCLEYESFDGDCVDLDFDFDGDCVDIGFVFDFDEDCVDFGFVCDFDLDVILFVVESLFLFEENLLISK